MKKMSFVFGLALVSIGVFALTRLNVFFVETREVVALTDKTDSLLSMPTPADILRAAELRQNKWQHVRVRITTLSDVDYNTVYPADLSGKVVWFSSITERDKEIAAFEASIANALGIVNAEKSNRPRSSIYASLVRELNRLSESEALSKRCLVYSNLQENTKAFSVFNPQVRALIRDAPDSAQKLLSAGIQLNRLNGVGVFLVCKPVSEKENELFVAMSNLIKRQLENAGAKVYVGGNLIIDHENIEQP